MSRSAIVSISPAQKLSAARKEVQAHLAHFGLKDLACAGVSAVYRIEGGASSGDIRRIAEELLCDPVAEVYSVDEKPGDSKTLFADVWYKPGVTDAVGDSVLKALRDLKIGSVERACSGTRYAFVVPAGSAAAVESKIAEFAGKQLLNPLVQECRTVKP
jgi:phosphoribosylformylglycinamidine (FGAM) synthase PurS component